MQTVTVDKQNLLAKLKENRTNHRKIFEEAVDGYKKRIIDLLEVNLNAAKAGKKVSLHDFNLTQPVDQTKDYDRAIAMLEMSLDNQVTLTEQDFRAYVMDEWGWKYNFISSNAMYSGTAAAAARGLDLD